MRPNLAFVFLEPRPAEEVAVGTASTEGAVLGEAWWGQLFGEVWLRHAAAKIDCCERGRKRRERRGGEESVELKGILCGWVDACLEGSGT